VRNLCLTATMLAIAAAPALTERFSPDQLAQRAQERHRGRDLGHAGGQCRADGCRDGQGGLCSARPGRCRTLRRDVGEIGPPRALETRNPPPGGGGLKKSLRRAADFDRVRDFGYARKSPIRMRRCFWNLTIANRTRPTSSAFGGAGAAAGARSCPWPTGTSNSL
jgi:hypothetical protein